jgi:hypothetical protein
MRQSLPNQPLPNEVLKIMGWKDDKMLLRYLSLRGQDLADTL